MKLRLALSVMAVLAIMAVGSANAVPYTMDFTNTTLDLGASTQIDLTNQYAAFGLTFDHVYRYYDSRDPWGGADLFGIDNGSVEQNYLPNTTGTVYFTQATNFMTFDWWTITGSLEVTAYDIANNVLGTFTGTGQGAAATINATGISYFTFHDGGGFVQISNLTYDRNPVPEPATMTLLGLGLLGAGVIRRRRGNK